MPFRLPILPCAALILVAAGCAIPDDYVDEPTGLDTWIGVPDRELVLKWGAPDAVYQMRNGGRILTWRRGRTESQGGEIYTVTEPHDMDGQKVMVPVTRQSPVITWQYQCVTSFEVDPDGYIVGHTEQGNDCVGLPLPDL